MPVMRQWIFTDNSSGSQAIDHFDNAYRGFLRNVKGMAWVLASVEQLRAEKLIDSFHDLKFGRLLAE